MIKIIKQGVIPIEKPRQTICQFCNAELEYTNEDINARKKYGISIT